MSEGELSSALRCLQTQPAEHVVYGTEFQKFKEAMREGPVTGRNMLDNEELICSAMTRLRNATLGSFLGFV